MQKSITILLLVVFSCFGFSEDSLENWAQMVFNNSSPYFASDYEENIFLKFKKKFSSLKIIKVNQLNGNRLFELNLTTKSDPYYLLFQMDDTQNIKRICRYLPVLEKIPKNLNRSVNGTVLSAAS